jgi:hypothetical protein
MTFCMQSMMEHGTDSSILQDVLCYWGRTMFLIDRKERAKMSIAKRFIEWSWNGIEYLPILDY